ncbi:MAG: hypothetical protein AAGD33_18655 [Actinomycetota bacterium]
MSILGTIRSVGEAFGVWRPAAIPLGCRIGTVAFRETKRSAWLANIGRPSEPLASGTRTRLHTLFPELDVTRIRVRRGCRLPANRFRPSGSIYAMTFGYTVYWRDQDLDEDDPVDFVKLVHEVVHVDQVRRLGGESEFACAYGEGYLAGGGDLPAYIKKPTAYHRNPLEAEAYTFEERFRNERGKVVPELVRQL